MLWSAGKPSAASHFNCALQVLETLEEKGAKAANEECKPLCKKRNYRVKDKAEVGDPEALRYGNVLFAVAVCALGWSHAQAQ